MYKHLFFDLDHTLWDFERNAHECLIEIYDTFALKSLGASDLENFLSNFSDNNKRHWDLLEKKLITIEDLRRKRFKDTLSDCGVEIDEDFGLKINDTFLELLPQKAHLIDGSIEILDYLQSKYELHIISNGWHEVQVQKMRSSEIHHYFGEVITNEKANARKPDKEIFKYALKVANASLSESLMIGDNFEADIKGAMQINLDTVFYNPERVIFEEKPTYEIFHLKEITEIL